MKVYNIHGQGPTLYLPLIYVHRHGVGIHGRPRLFYARRILPLVCVIRGHRFAEFIIRTGRMQDFLDGNGPSTGIPMLLCERCGLRS